MHKPGVTPTRTHSVLFMVKNTPSGAQTPQQALGLTARKNFRLLYLVPAMEAGLVEMTIRDKPKGRLQKYRLTEKGGRLLKSLKSEGGSLK